MMKRLLRPIWSKAKNRTSRRMTLALVKAIAGPLVAWLLSRGIEIEEQALQDGLTALFVLLGGWIGIDGARDWRARNSEDRSQEPSNTAHPEL